MRLGSYPCNLLPGSRAQAIYNDTLIFERHRHRFEFNNAYRERIQALGLVPSGVSPDQRLVEIMELRGHSWFLGTQFHPQFQSRPNRPHPLFASFIGAALQHAQGVGRSLVIEEQK